MAAGAAGTGTHQTVGDLLGQRAEELGSADAVLETVGAVCGLVGTGDPAGILSTVPQQIQSDRAVLVVVAKEMERRVAELLGSDPGVRVTDDLEGEASHGRAAGRALRCEGECPGGGDGDLQRSAGAFRHAPFLPGAGSA